MMIRDDLEDFKQKLGALTDELKTLQSRTEGDVLVVPDTNVSWDTRNSLT